MAHGAMANFILTIFREGQKISYAWQGLMNR